jgi:hypothetical protein
MSVFISKSAFGQHAKYTESLDDIVRRVGADFEVALAQLHTVGLTTLTNTANGLGSVPAQYSGIQRCDTGNILGVVKGTPATSRWVPLQNHRMFAIAADMVAQGFRADTAGVFQGGRKTFCLLSRPDVGDIEVTAGDTVRPFLLLWNGLDGRTGFGASYTAVRVVCENTLAMALRHCKGMSHTKTNVLTYAKVTDELTENIRVTAQVYRSLSNARALPVTHLARIMPDSSEKVREQVLSRAGFEAWPGIVGAGNKGSSLWDIYNGITDILSHSKRASTSLAASLSDRPSVYLARASALVPA